jgi:ppGpp synthetase/RelA/SpoT-type nucleotidyltranferase
MPNQKLPKTISEYKDWAIKAIEVNFDSNDTKTNFEVNSSNLLNTVTNHPFYKEIDQFLQQCASEYSQKFGEKLFMDGPSVPLITKTYDSMVNKSFRYNVLWNPHIPSPPYPKSSPPNDWLIPNNWFSRVNDIVRTRIVCNYIDGPKFLVSKFKQYAKEHQLKKPRSYSQQKDVGYYAYHTYIKFPTGIMLGPKGAKVESELEIQITTMLQQVLNNITHDFYEDSRLQQPKDPNAWKWEFKSNRFRGGYLSHTLHLLEAIIHEVRTENLKTRKNKSNGT